jgi:hypothetical protein
MSYLYNPTPSETAEVDAVQEEVQIINRGTNWSIGDNVTVYTANPDGHKAAVHDGTAVSPITAAAPSLKVSQTQAVTSGLTGDGSTQMGAIYGSSSGTAASKSQGIGVMGSAKNVGTEGEPDACGLYGVGRILAGGKGRAFGAFVAGRRDGEEQRATGIEVYVENVGGVDSYDKPTEAETTKGVYIHAGTARIACGVQVTVLSGESPSVDVAYAINKFAAATAGYQDNSNAERSIQIKGTHSKAALTVAAGSSGIVVGAESSSFLESSGSLIDLISASETLSTVGVARNTGANNVAWQVSNSKGDIRLATAGAAGGFWTGSAEGDSGLLVNAAKTMHFGRAGGVAAQLKIGAGIGFYGTAPQTKQEVTGSRATGAALTSLLEKLATIGLITNGSSA